MVSGELAKGLAVVCEVNEAKARAEAMSQFLKAPLNPPDLQNFFFHFHVTVDDVFVTDLEKRKLTIDFDKNHLDYARRGHRGKNELVAKALGYVKGHRSVLDLSMGMGIDSVFLTQLGFSVTAVERSPVLYALLKNALEKTQQEDLRKIFLYWDDSLHFLKTKKNELSVDTIFFDPMYPHKKKSALPKQEMVIFRDLVGNDMDAAEVLAEALTWPVKRVVVKRPVHAEELLPGVRHAYLGKVVRYDTYVVG